MLFTIAMVCFVLVVAGALVVRDVVQQVQGYVASRALDVARVIAQAPDVQQAFDTDNPSAVLQPIAERWRHATGAAFIVIANMDQIRLTHTIPENIGTPMADLYREPVLRGQEYVYVGQGSLPISLRANVPIFNAEHTRQVGFVSVGFYLHYIYGMAWASAAKVLYALLGALLLSVLGAVWLARDVKRAMFGMEPYEIATLLRERTAMFEAVREGIVAVDTAGRIRFLNKSAALLLGIPSSQAVGLAIDDFWPQPRVTAVAATGQAVYDEELRVNGLSLLANSVPIVVDGALAGVVISFRDRTEMSRLAEELTGVNRLVEVMRAQAHEYKNKLHAIAGLIQLGRGEEAVDFITENAAPQQDLFEQLRQLVQDATTFGLLLGKSSRAKELGAELCIAPQTHLTALPPHFTSGDMVLVLGNLMENALEAVAEAAVRRVTVYLGETDDGLCIKVSDTGPGIDPAMGDEIYRYGFTTKPGSRGYGLALVARKVAVNGGTISYSNLPGGGVEFTVFIPAGREANNTGMMKHDEKNQSADRGR